jgi:hypothetical protein
MPENPFTVRGMIQNPNEFIGRKTEISHIVARLKTMQSCSVVGERRIGKSSLLYHLFQTGNERLGDEKFRFVYIELTDASAQTVVDFLQTVLQALDLPTNSIKDDNKPNRNLVAFDNAIKTLVSEGVKVVLCLDEFEGLFFNPQEFSDGFFNHLRSMINQRRLALVTASRQPLEVYAIEEKLTSPFFNLLSVTELGNFTHEEAETFIDYYQSIAQFDQKELEFINWYSDPHPIKLQIFCEKMLEWREQGWSNDEALEETAKVYGQFLGGRHDWKKLRRVTTLFSIDGFSKILANLKTARDLAAGK